MATVISSITSSTASPFRGWLRGFIRRTRAGLVSLALACAMGAGMPVAGEPSAAAREPLIAPDYSDLILPPNIAPLNFVIRVPGTGFRVSLSGGVGAPLEVKSSGPKIRFPQSEWRRLLGLNRGRQLRIEVGVLGENQQWQGYPAMTNWVAAEDIDPILIYRKIHPSHNSWRTMGIYQRDLTSFDETPILENRRFDHDCCHCHALRNNDPNQAIILIRSTTYQNSLLVISNGLAEAIGGLAGFSAWNPRADVVVSAFSKPRLLLHSARPGDMRDIGELEGWLGYFRLGSGAVREVPTADTNRLQSFPAWSPDGAWLYYCSAPNPLANPTNTLYETYSTVKYDLMRVAYDPARDHWGEPEMVLRARDLGRSVGSTSH